MFDECRYNRYGLVVHDFGQHNKAGVAFSEGDDTGVFRDLAQVIRTRGRYPPAWWIGDNSILRRKSFESQRQYAVWTSEVS